MNPLQRTIIEKAGHDNGFEHVLSSAGDAVILASARHRSQAVVTASVGGFEVRFHPATPALLPELLRSFQPWAGADDVFFVPTLPDLAALLRRTANLSQVLPNQAVHDYHAAVAQAVEAMPTEARGTEVERLVRQRVGQARYRDALLAYWGGACAVTGINVPEVLRASHAKPWAVCDSDAERLDVFNGLLLAAHLDALFDQFLLSFDEHGRALISPQLDVAACEVLGLRPTMQMRWMAPEHQRYMGYHRQRFLTGP